MLLMVFYDYTKFEFRFEGLNEVKIIQISIFLEIQSDSRNMQPVLTQNMLTSGQKWLKNDQN